MTRTPSVSKKRAGAKPKPVRPRPVFKAMEERRMRAAEQFAKHVSQADIVRELGMAHQTV